MSNQLKYYLLERVIIGWTLIDGIVKIAITAGIAYLIAKAINYVIKTRKK